MILTYDTLEDLGPYGPLGWVTAILFSSTKVKLSPTHLLSMIGSTYQCESYVYAVRRLFRGPLVRGPPPTSNVGHFLNVTRLWPGAPFCARTSITHVVTDDWTAIPFLIDA